MHKGFLAGSVILFALSFACVIGTVVEVIAGKYGMGALRFWSAVVFHAVTAAAALFLLAKARRGLPKAEEGEGS